MTTEQKQFDITVVAGTHMVGKGTIVDGEAVDGMTVLRKGQSFKSEKDLTKIFPEKFVITAQRAPVQVQEATNPQDDPNRPPYEDMTKEQLMVVAEEVGANAQLAMNKAAIIAAIDAAEAANDQD